MLRLDRYGILLLLMLALLALGGLFFRPKQLIESPEFSLLHHGPTQSSIVNEVKIVPEEDLKEGDKLNIESDQSYYSRIQRDGNRYSMMLEPGDTFTKLMRELGFQASYAHTIASAVNRVHNLSKLRVGDQVHISFEGLKKDREHNFNDISALGQIIIDFNDNRIALQYNGARKIFEAKIVSMELETKIAKFSGRIKNNFISAAMNSGLSKAIAIEFINILSHEVDFQRDLAPGNKFTILHEAKINKNGNKVLDGKILYCALELRNRKIELYFHSNKDGSSGYFYKDGSNMKKPLLRTPLKTVSISSGFGMREHPIYGYSRMHKGLDYRAVKGTPIMSAGDGIVEILKYNRGYGRYIKIKHNQKYSTLYAHLNNFTDKIRVGSRVKQGDIIGYVGSTGSSTGPHLHYEVHINGKQVNPSKLNITTSSDVLTGSQLLAFKDNKNKVDNLLNKSTFLSMSDNITNNR